jgi:ubiquitin
MKEKWKVRKQKRKKDWQKCRPKETAAAETEKPYGKACAVKERRNKPRQEQQGKNKRSSIQWRC